MAWNLTDDVDEFLTGAGDFLRARPVENTVLLTIANTLRRHGPAVYGEDPPVLGWCDGGAFLRTPPRGALLTAMPPEAAADLARALKGSALPSVDGPPPVVEAFAAEWQRLTGATARVHGARRLFRRERLVPPVRPAVGQARVAGPGDRDLLIDWMTTFEREIGEEPTLTEAFVDDKLSHGGLSLWEVNGVPVSMAGSTRREAGMVRVQAVYTPREHRARGFAGAATVAVTQAALDAGATEIVLFTDVHNATSNALYQRIGYQPVSDRTTLELSP